MRPNDFIIYGEEGMLYKAHCKELARQGVPSSAMPSFKDWQNGEIKTMMSDERIFAKEASAEFAAARKQDQEEKERIERANERKEQERQRKEKLADNLFLEKLQASGLDPKKASQTLEWLVKHQPQFKARIRYFLCSEDEKETITLRLTAFKKQEEKLKTRFDDLRKKIEEMAKKMKQNG